MDGETNGSQQEAQGRQGQKGQQQEAQGQQEVTGGNSSPDYEKQIAERDEKIASPEAQVAEAAKNAETVEHLCGVIDEKRARTLEDGELLVVSHQPTFRSSCIPLQIHSWPVLLHGTRA